MTLRTRAIDAIIATGEGPLVTRSCAVDALLAAGLLHDPTSPEEVEASARRVLDMIAFLRDDEARIERAARAIYKRHRDTDASPEWDVLPRVQRGPWMDDARVALAAADQEDTDA